MISTFYPLDKMVGQSVGRGVHKLNSGDQFLTKPTVSAGMVRGLLDFASSKGADGGLLLKMSDIDPAILADSDNRVAMAKYRELMLGAKQLTGDEALALHFAEQIDLTELSVVGLITHASATMMDALTQLNRYGQLVAEVVLGAEQQFEIVREGDEIWMVDNRLNPNEFIELTEMTFARLASGPRRFTDKLHLGAVHFTHHEPAYGAEYRKLFRAPLTFGSHRNAMLLDEGWLTYPVSQTPNYVFGILTAHAANLSEQLQRSKAVRSKVEMQMMQTLHRADVKIDTVAREMGLSKQTLYRQLKAESTTFEKVLDELRQTLAKHYLTGKKVSVNETAYLLGFSHPAAFSRAFKRWTGSSPRGWTAAVK